MTEFRNLLFAWFAAMWPKLCDYQRTFVEGGYKDQEHTWAYAFGVEAFTIYEWRVLQAAIAQTPVLKARIQGEIRTAFGMFAALDRAQDIGAVFFNAAHKRMTSGQLLFGEPNALFDAVFPGVEAFLTMDAVPHHAVTPLYGVRIGAPIPLDEDNTISLMPQEVRTDFRWRNTAWDDEFDHPVQFEHRFRLPILSADVPVRQQPVIEACRDAVENALISIAVAQRSTAVSGPLLIENMNFVPAGSSALVLPGGSPRRGLGRTQLQSERFPEMQAAWRCLVGRTERRVRLAGERLAIIELARDGDSALLEAVTALEAILGDDYRNELPHRLSLLAARLVAKDLGLSQRLVRDTIFAAFQRRTIVLRGKESQDDVAEVKRLTLFVDSVVRRLTQLRVLEDGRFKEDPVDVLLDN
ncbi:MAG: hypothetical protein ABSE64_08085 [Vulcanimicrobiaceae bacterium]|jgi:hypothetical protein